MVSPLNKKDILHLESWDVIHFILVALFIYSFHVWPEFVLKGAVGMQLSKTQMKTLKETNTQLTTINVQTNFIT